MVALAAGRAGAQPSQVSASYRQIPGEVFILPHHREDAGRIVQELERTGLFKRRFVGRRSGGILFRVQPGWEDAARLIASCHALVRSANVHWGGEAGFVPFVGVPNDVHVSDQWYLGPQSEPMGIPSKKQLHRCGIGVPPSGHPGRPCQHHRGLALQPGGSIDHGRGA